MRRAVLDGILEQYRYVIARLEAQIQNLSTELAAARRERETLIAAVVAAKGPETAGTYGNLRPPDPPAPPTVSHDDPDYVAYIEAHHLPEGTNVPLEDFERWVASLPQADPNCVPVL